MAGFADPGSLKHRCIAHNARTGEPCKRPAIAGGTVCTSHGGKTKHVQRKARELLDRAVEPVLHQLRDIALKPSSSDSDKLRAIQMVLDRSGLGPGMTVEHEVKPWQVTMEHVFKQSSGMPSVHINRDLSPETLAELEPAPGDYATSTHPGFNEQDDIEDAEVVMDSSDHGDDPRDSLDRIVPPRGLGEVATVQRATRVGSANPPRRRK